MKKKILAIIALSVFVSPSFTQAAVWVNGYTRSDGTYVSGHYRSEPNGLKYDNYSWSPGDDLYNNSYYSSGYESDWYTPSYTWDEDYYSGYNYNTSVLGSDYNNYYVDDYYSNSLYYDSYYGW